jgi:hypothetical protein
MARLPIPVARPWLNLTRFRRMVALNSNPRFMFASH